MTKHHHLEFRCCKCGQPVTFSVFHIARRREPVSCTHCGQNYAFQDPDLCRQIRKFCALCHQIRESEEILSSTAVAIDIGEHHVQFPYKLLLTRLNSQFDLLIGNERVTLTFRVEPLRDGLEEKSTVQQEDYVNSIP